MPTTGRSPRRIVNVLVVAAAVACGPGSQIKVEFGEPEGEPKLKLKAMEQSVDQDLVVLFSSPVGSVAGQPEISVSFNHPMKELGKADQDPFLGGLVPFKLEPPLEGEYRWLGSRTATFAPSGPVPQATEFRATVPEGLRDLTGAVLRKEYSWTFTTPPPEVVASTPSSGDAWVKPDQPIDLYFNQRVDPARVAAGAKLTAAGKEVAFKATRRDKDDEKSVRIVPASRLPLASEARFVIGKGLTGMEGPLRMERSFELGFRTYGPLEIIGVSCWSDDKGTPETECEPEGGVQIQLSNPVFTKDLEKLVSVSPKQPGLGVDRWSEKSREIGLYVEGHWEPGVAYEVVVSAGLRDVFGQKIQGGRKVRFRTLDFYPRWLLKFDGNVLERTGSRTLPVSVLNTDRLEAFMLAEGREEAVVPMLEKVRESGSDWIVGDSRAVKVPLSYPKVKNKSVLAKIDLGKAKIGKDGAGVVILRVQNPDDEYDWTYEMVRVSGIGITSKVSGDRVLAWVTDLETGQPLGGARVTIRTSGNGLLWEGKTDDRGIASVEGSKLWEDWYALEWEERCPYVFASTGSDFNYTTTCGEDGISPWRFDVDYDENAGQRQLAGLVFTERGVYRRGEEVRLKGLVRFLEKGKLSVPSGNRLSVVVTDSQGEEITSHEVKANGYGGFDLAVALPAGGRTGYHQVRVHPVDEDETGRMTIYGSFGVEEYRAPSFRVDVRGARAEVIRGEEAAFTASGEFLFGAPMAGSRAEWYASGSRGWFDPPGWDGLVFDDGAYAEGSGWEDAAYGLTQSGGGVLDSKGALSFAFPTDIEKMYGPVDYAVESTVTGPDLADVTGRTWVRVHPASFYVGLSVGDVIVAKGKTVEVGVAAVTPEGEAVAGRKVAVSLIRRQWQYVQSEGLYEDAYRSWNVVDKVEGTCKVETAAGPVTCSFKIPASGEYVVRAEAKDKSGRPTAASRDLWAWGSDSVSWMSEDELGVEMHSDKDVYTVGDRARILVENPFPEAEALITVEHHGIAEVRRARFTDRAALVELDVTEDMRPNVYVTVALVRGRAKAPPEKGGPDPGRPSVKVGYVNLRVGIEDRALDVSVVTDRQEYRPGDEVGVDVVVRDLAGKGRQAEVTLFVVDEAVLMLTGYQPPDPLGYFYRPRALGVSVSDSRMSILVRRAFGAEKGETGGGGYESEAGPEVREDFRTTAYFNPHIETDGSGKAHASFELPDSLTRFRVMAVAATKDDCFGRGSADFRVKKPLLLKPALPRFVRVGDRFEAGVVVHDGGGAGGKVAVSAQAEGLFLAGEAERIVDLPAGGSVLVRFPFEARSAGAATLTFRASGGGFEDAMRLERPVRLPVVTETVATFGDTEDSAVEGIGKLEGVIPEEGGLKVRMASTAFVGLDRAVESLVRYPFGCAEQLTSRLVPAVALGEVIDTFGLDVDLDRERLSETVGDLEKMQHWSGGWGYFAGGSCPYPWLSAYVLWGLSEARERGYPVSDGTIDGGAEFLGRVLRDEQWCYPMPEWWSEVGLATKAYIVYVLAHVGRPEKSYNDYLYEHRAEMPLFARLLLAGAIEKSGGDDKQVDEILRDVLNQIKQTPSSAHLVENLGDGYLYIMHSEIRDTALALDVLLETDPDHPLVAKMARWLMQARGEDGTWGSTQSDAWALIAMTDYLEAREAEEPDFLGGVFLGETSLFTALFEGRSLDEQGAFIPMADLLEAGPGLLGFAKKGAGRLYYSASLSYARDSLPEDPVDRGFFIERSYVLVPDQGEPRLLVPDPKTKALGTVKAGESVIVEITIVTTGKRHFVAVEDPIPAGLEVVNFRFDTSSLADLDVLSVSSWWSPFYHTEILDDRVLLFADDVQPGIHRHRYLAKATTPGDFVVAPAKVHEMYNQEVFGRTGASTFVIEE